MRVCAIMCDYVKDHAAKVLYVYEEAERGGRPR